MGLVHPKPTNPFCFNAFIALTQVGPEIWGGTGHELSIVMDLSETKEGTAC